MTTIVKVERPPENEDAPWLMYDKDREHLVEVDCMVIPQHVKDAMGNDLEAYFVGAWSSIVGWGLSERVSDAEGF